MKPPLRLMLVGPVPPPSGGMANQTRQLKRLLEGEGVQVELVATNAPYRPAWAGSIRGLRAVFRLLPYLAGLWRAAGRADVVHVMANSGLAWDLFAAPAIQVARWRGRPVVVNYRGGLAREFLSSAAGRVRPLLRKAQALVVPSPFLQGVFAEHGVSARIVPNIIDTAMFSPPSGAPYGSGYQPEIVVARNLEQLYGNDTAIRAIALLRDRYPALRLRIAGSGPERESLAALAAELGVAERVVFTGRLDVAQMAELYRSADLVLNPSRADNTPNSVLEALACAVPVVSTNVGGVPFLVKHGVTAWLVPPDDPAAMADGIDQVMSNHSVRAALSTQGLALARGFSWPVVRDQWLAIYESLHKGGRMPGAAAVGAS